MTTLAKIAANRANAQLSTGPRTPAGKAAAARNAVRHGLLSAAPVVSGEDPAEWDRHLAGVADSLAPVGLLEEQLAGRVAVLLWRLNRVARFEAAGIAAGLDAAVLPEPPPDEDTFGGLGLRRPTGLPEAARTARRKAAEARRAAAKAQPLVDYMRSFADRPDDEPVSARVAVEVLMAAEQVLLDYKTTEDPPSARGPKVLAKLGRLERKVREVAWTAGLVRQALGMYAGLAAAGADWLARRVRSVLAAELRRQTRTERRKTRLAAGLDERRRSQPVWRAAAELMPRVGVDDRIARYETHLGKQLAVSLHELEPLQALRAGRPVAPPVAIDVNVVSDQPAG